MGRVVQTCKFRCHDQDNLEWCTSVQVLMLTSLGVFTLVTRSWAASEFLTWASKVNMMPNGDRSQFFDAHVKILLPRHL